MNTSYILYVLAFIASYRAQGLPQAAETDNAVLQDVSVQLQELKNELNAIKTRVTQQQETISLQQEAITQQQETNTLQQGAISLQQETISIQQEAIMSLQRDNADMKQKFQMTSETAFSAYDTSGDKTYSEGDVIEYREEFLDEGGNYDAPNSKYTCPVTGIYMFNTFQLNGGDDTYSEVYIVIGDNQIAGYYSYEGGKMGSMSVIARCTSGETVQVICNRSGTRVHATYSGMRTSVFNGMLLALV